MISRTTMPLRALLKRLIRFGSPPQTPSPTGFAGSGSYWESRYKQGGTSGIGSYGEFAEFKAEVINRFVETNSVNSVIEFGCGDGNQLRLMRYPSYTGIDVSEAAVARCRELYAADSTKRFLAATPDASYGTFDLALSLDVIFHLVEDTTFEAYMTALFRSADRFVIIYSSNGDPTDGTYRWPAHVRHRHFTDWIDRKQTGWQLIDRIANRFPFRVINGIEHGSFADFYFYRKS